MSSTAATTFLSQQLQAHPDLLRGVQAIREHQSVTLASGAASVLYAVADVSRSIESAATLGQVHDPAGAHLVLAAAERLAAVLADTLAAAVAVQDELAELPTIPAESWPGMFDAFDGALKVPIDMSADSWRRSPTPALTWRFMLWAYVGDLARDIQFVRPRGEYLGSDIDLDRALIGTLAHAVSLLAWLALPSR